jgi:uncharacterized protein (DUF1330 family)
MKSRTWLLAIVGTVVLAATSGGILRAGGAAPRGYVVAEVTVTDPAAYKQYAAAVSPIVAKFGGRYLVRGGLTVPREGEPPAERVVVIEFASLAAARSFEDSQEYQAAMQLRHKAARSRVFLVEGVPE